MVWFTIDDGFWSHPKTLALPDAAIALWVRAGSWSGQQLTDGVIQRDVLPLFRAKKASIDALVRAGLWEEFGDGYRFHDWLDYNRSRERVFAERRATKDRVAASRARKRGDTSTVSNGVTPPVTAPDTDGVSNTAPALPLPSPPEDQESLSTAPRQTSTPKAAPYSEGFEAWWKLYPRRESKGDAWKAFEVLRKARQLPLPSVLFAATETYARRTAADPTYRKLPAGWLRARKWEDEEAEAPRPQRDPSRRRFTAEYEDES